MTTAFVPVSPAVSSPMLPMATADCEQVFLVWVGGTPWALPARSVQTVFRVPSVTPVPLAPSVIEGLVNLRGRVVIAINLTARLLGAASAPIDPAHPGLAVAVELGDDVYALIVDTVGDVVAVGEDQRVTPPAHVRAHLARLTTDWFQTADGLVPLLDLARLVDIETDRRSGIDRRAPSSVTSGAKP